MLSNQSFFALSILITLIISGAILVGYSIFEHLHTRPPAPVPAPPPAPPVPATTSYCEKEQVVYSLLRAFLSTLPPCSATTIISHFVNRNGTAFFYPFVSSPSFPSLIEQVAQAYDKIELLSLILEEQEAQQFIGTSILYLSLGVDDYIYFFLGEGKSSGLDEVSNSVRGLYRAGVRKIVIMGFYPLGCAPSNVFNDFLAGRNRRRTRVCINQINLLIMQHNHLLNEHISNLSNLNLRYSDAQFVFCDLYKGFLHILSNLTSFTWDFYNPSEAVNTLLAESAWSGQPLVDICQPLTIQALTDLENGKPSSSLDSRLSRMEM